jgi:putative DNA primase/helicase
MNTTDQTPNSLAQRLERATTANETAAALYPHVANNCDAFLEREAAMPEFPYLEILSLNDDFWAWTLGYLGSPSQPAVFVSEENRFRCFNPNTGIYEPITDSALIGELVTNLDTCAAFFPSRLRIHSFLALKNRQRLRSVIDRAKDLLTVDADFFQPKPYTLALKNGILNISNQAFTTFTPNHPLKETLPVKYDAEAKCEMFLDTFLANVLAPDDIDLLQRYLSQVLDGTNHSQTILLLNGESGWGKSSLIKIIGGIMSWNNAGIIRDQVFRNAHELSHYQGKRFLLHPDMPTDFLDRREASLFKQLVGGDPLWAEDKSGRMTTIEGNFPCILACNGRPRLRIDCDHEAWMRRLLVVPFKKAGHDQHFGKMAELIVKNEAPGILNWLLDGRRKLVKAKFQMTQTEEQQARTKALVMASQSPKGFVQQCIERKEGAELGITELYSHYQEWCVANQITPFAGQGFNQMAREEIEMSFGLRYRHDLETAAGKAVRGWKDLALVKSESEKAKTESARSV